jgi:hypothetical protein
MDVRFFDWFVNHGPAKTLALAQHNLGTDWGHDCIWCGAAYYWLRHVLPRQQQIHPSSSSSSSSRMDPTSHVGKTRPLAREMIPCAVIPVPISHKSSHTISKSADYVAGGYSLLRMLFNYTTTKKDEKLYNGTDEMIEKFIEHRKRFHRSIHRESGGVLSYIGEKPASSSFSTVTLSKDNNQKFQKEDEEGEQEQEQEDKEEDNNHFSNFNYKHHVFGEVVHAVVESQYLLVRSGCLGAPCGLGAAIEHNPQVKQKTTKNHHV